MAECRNNTSIVGCFVPADGSSPVGVAINYIFDGDGALFATVYTTPDGTPITVATYLGGGTVLVGACPAINVDVEHELLCDDADANPATPPVAFVRRYERRYNAGTGVFISQTVVDLQLDFVTPYVVSAPANVSANCAMDYEFDEEIVCDGLGVSMIRRQTQINGVLVVLGYFTFAGVAIPAPTLPIGACPNCVDEPFRGVLTAWAAVR